MTINKLKVSGLAVIVLMALGCAGAQKKKIVGADDVPMERVQIPAHIWGADRPAYEKTLLLMPVSHPDRVTLREKLIEGYLAEFQALDAENLPARRAIYEHCLWLHLSEDFNAGRVSEALREMAAWSTKRYSKRGDEAIVGASLRILIILEPGNVSHQNEYDELNDWMQRSRDQVPDDIRGLSSLADALVASLELAPSVELADRIAEVLIKRHRELEQRFQEEGLSAEGGFNPFLAHYHGQLMRSFSLDLVAIYFLAGDVGQVRKHMDALADEGLVGSEDLAVVEQLVGGRQQAEGYYRLSRHLIGSMRNIQGGMHACVLARASDPADPRYPLCVGQTLELIDRVECGVDFYLEAAAISSEPEVLSQSMALIADALWQLHTMEDRSASERVMIAAETLIERTMEDAGEPSAEIAEPAARLLYVMGNVEFDDGEIVGSSHYLTRSYEISPEAHTLFKLAEIQFWSGEFQAAVELLEASEELVKEELKVDEYQLANLAERKGEALRELGKDVAARDEYSRALYYWRKPALQIKRGAEAGIRQGHILDALDKPKESLAAFLSAIRMEPGRHSTYTEIISFLVIRERFEDAVEIYRLAYNQDRIESTWKIYYSLWLDGLSLRLNKVSYDLARGYLEGSSGNSWQDRLARFHLGVIDYDELARKAANLGQETEARFYSGILDLIAGRRADAKNKLVEVVNSNLYGFYEYRLAREILRRDLTAPVGGSEG